MNDQHNTKTVAPNPQSEPQQAGMDSTVSNVVSFLTNVPRQSIVYRFLVMVASVVVIGYGISAASKIIGPLFLAMFLAIILLVPLHWMQKKGCPKVIALILVIFFTITVFVGISYNVAKSLNYLVAKSPEYKANFEAKIAALDKRLERIGFAISGLTVWQKPTEENKENTPEDEENTNENNTNLNNNTIENENNTNSTTPEKIEPTNENLKKPNINPNINSETINNLPDKKIIDEAVSKPATETNQILSEENTAKVEVGMVDGSEVGAENATDAEKTGENKNEAEAESENQNIETTTLGQLILGGRSVGFGLLKDDPETPFTESKPNPKQNTKLKEKSQLIILNSQDVMVWLRTSLVAIREIGESAFLVLIFTIFMIFEAASFPTKVDRAFGFDGPINNQHLQRIAGEIRRYLFLKAISSMMSAVTATIVYWFFGVPAMFFWGVVAFFLYFIPNVGGIIASIIPGLLIFMTHDWQGVVVYMICLVGIECTIGYGIEPKMLGHGLGISTVVILISLFMWGMLLGPIGLFMAAPLTIMVKITLQAFKETEWIATLIDRK
ncbi:MAG: AI-2E family transporter [Planctomycetaceae bacterium]|jgi:predicted PurR-regulated permease PerM|nr:AI-2E family transporter [Planctomycetaceae bacterium]